MPDIATHVSDEQKAFLLENGYLRLDHVTDEQELNWMREIYDDLFSGRRQLGPHSRFKQLGGRDELGREALPQILGWKDSAPEMLETRYFSNIQAIAQRIYPGIVFTGGHMILKPAGHGVETPWHQDQAYHRPDLIYTTLNFWMPLDGATVEGGCMHYVPGSHLGVMLPHVHLDDADPDSALVAQDQEYWRLNGVAVPLPRGSVAIHHSYTMHAAGPNLSGQPRRALITTFGLPPTPRSRALVFPWQDRMRRSKFEPAN